LLGGAVSDTMSGGRGNDTDYVQDAGDQVFENAGEGADPIAASVSFTSRPGPRSTPSRRSPKVRPMR
jgi:Ca2+-binding RTX toxin-like protein